MTWLAQTLAAAIVAFASTNVDGLLLLIVFFAQFETEQISAGKHRTDEKKTPGLESHKLNHTNSSFADTQPESDTDSHSGGNDRDNCSVACVVRASPLTAVQIFLGQFLSFTVLITVSLIGFAAGRVFLEHHYYLGLLGIVPIVCGLWKFVQSVLKCKREGHCACCQCCGKRNGDTDTEQPRVAQNANDEQTRRLVSESVSNVKADSDDVLAPDQSSPPSWTHTLFFVHPNIVEVMGLTLANSADNVAVYIPLFASSTVPQLIITLIVFYVMMAVWLMAAYMLVYFPVVARTLEKCGQWIVSLLLIGLGIYVLWVSTTFDWMAGHADTANAAS